MAFRSLHAGCHLPPWTYLPLSLSPCSQATVKPISSSSCILCSAFQPYCHFQPMMPSPQGLCEKNPTVLPECSRMPLPLWSWSQFSQWELASPFIYFHSTSFLWLIKFFKRLSHILLSSMKFCETAPLHNGLILHDMIKIQHISTSVGSSGVLCNLRISVFNDPN